MFDIYFMKHLLHYHSLSESLVGFPPPIDIETFLYAIRFPHSKIEGVSQWWNLNRPDFEIYYFPFSSPKPIMGCFLGEKEIAINSKIPIPPDMSLFLALHESGHCNQHAEGRFEEGYFNSVMEGDRARFLNAYAELEREANDFAQNSMLEMGFNDFIRMQMQRLRGNEMAGNQVYQMMSSDIQRFGVTNFFDLLKSQIL